MGKSSFFDEAVVYDVLDENNSSSSFYEGDGDDGYEQIDPIAVERFRDEAEAAAVAAKSSETISTANAASTASDVVVTTEQAGIATTAASIATAQATDSANSATASHVSEVNSAASEVNAASSATAAATSEVNAASSAAASHASEVNSGISEVNAGASASAAHTSELNAASYAASADWINGAGTATPQIDGVASVGTATKWAREDHKHPTDTTRAPLASPVFTGTPQAPTPSLNTVSPQIATTAFVAGRTRELLSANRTYYVNAGTGNDGNDGLTSGSAFATLQQAMNVAASVDLGVYNITIFAAGGSYVGFSLQTLVGAGTVTFVGDETTQSNCTINGAGGSGGGRAVYGNSAVGNFIIAGFRLIGANTQDVYVNGGNVTLRNCEYAGTANYRIYVSAPGILTTLGNNTKISGGGIGCFLSDTLGNLWITNTAYTVTANLTYTGAFFTCRYFSVASVIGAVFNLGSFTVTGPRYYVGQNAVIIGSGAGASYFPGSSAGTATAGGIYG